MSASSSDGRIKERWNAASAPCNDDTSVALERITTHLNVAAKPFATADGFSRCYHVEFGHTFPANRMDCLKHSELNCRCSFHLFKFPSGLNFTLGVNN
jgi:hypothetical protein